MLLGNVFGFGFRVLRLPLVGDLGVKAVAIGHVGDGLDAAIGKLDLVGSLRQSFLALLGVVELIPGVAVQHAVSELVALDLRSLRNCLTA